MRLAQIVDENGQARARRHRARRSAARQGRAHDATSSPNQAIEAGAPLRKMIADRGVGKPVDLAARLKEKRVLNPIDHKDPAHVYVTGTGLTHLGSAEGRDKMHKNLADPETLTDSMKMFKMGLEGGKPKARRDGRAAGMVLQGRRLDAGGAGRRSRLAGLRARRRRRAGDRRRLCHRARTARRCASASRSATNSPTTSPSGRTTSISPIPSCAPSSFGPELLLGDLPADVQGASRIRRGKEVLWEKPFLSGEQNMSHTIANLEAHHFKYALFRRPGDVHVHFFGTATLSFSDGFKTREGRRVRDRSRSLRPAAAQPADDRQGGEGEGEGAVAAVANSLPRKRLQYADIYMRRGLGLTPSPLAGEGPRRGDEGSFPASPGLQGCNCGASDPQTCFSRGADPSSALRVQRDDW